MINKDNSLSDEVLKVIRENATEPPFHGKYNLIEQHGTYLCRACGLGLFYATNKFTSHCGWPSFDEAIKETVSLRQDIDGMRQEIICSRCYAHLGHVFYGEQFTQKNTRYCVNSLSLDFVPNINVCDTEEVIVAGGCFWGIEYHLKRLSGVVKTEVGYIGGEKKYPTYKEVCSGLTGHLEAVRVLYDSLQLSGESLLKYFFEIHNPMQKNGQGPDIGKQYSSAVFYYNENQKNIAQNLINQLSQNNDKIVTQLRPMSIFWAAEEYHQNYYDKLHKTPYCHMYTKRFD